MLARVALVRPKLLDRARDDVEVALDQARNHLRRVPLRHALRATGGCAGLAYCGCGGAPTRLTGCSSRHSFAVRGSEARSGPVGKEKPGSWPLSQTPPARASDRETRNRQECCSTLKSCCSQAGYCVHANSAGASATYGSIAKMSTAGRTARDLDLI